MTTRSQQQHAEAFHALHSDGRVLVLANAWDAASARIFELAGAPAIATSSAAVAWSLGYPDGEQLGRADLIRSSEHICRAVAVPVSIDIERGFGSTVADICETVRGLIHAGAVGINIEDGRMPGGEALRPATVLVEKIAAIRRVAEQAGLRLFINARTDVYFLPASDSAARFEDSVRRLNAYAEAGADGVFAPGLTDLEEIGRLVQAVPRPLNIYAGYAGVPTVAELARMGVRRVSVGCGPMQAVLALARRIGTEVLTAGTYTAMTEAALSVREVNAMFAARAASDPLV